MKYPTFEGSVMVNALLPDEVTLKMPDAVVVPIVMVEVTNPEGFVAR